MQDYDPRSTFADEAAAIAHDQRGDEQESVALLAELAGDGRVLELAIGTGRIALPLAATGLTVDGIDFAPAMLDRLRAKPGGEQLALFEADFADVDVSGRYALIYIVWNSFFNLLTQERQTTCFANVAEHLEPGGLFLIEAFVPAFLHRYDNYQNVSAEHMGTDKVGLAVIMHDAAGQRLDQQHVVLSPGGTRMTPVAQRYAWPAELDLMAKLAGLELADRWGGWNKEPFTSDSALHVSVYRK